MKRSYFSELAPHWDSLPGPPDAALRAQQFVDAVLPAGCRRVLDAGCGTGILLAPLLGIQPHLDLVVALDFALPMLVEARRKHEAPALACVCADLAAPPLAAAAFDAVLCFHVLPHLPDLPATLSQLASLLHPGGRIAVGHMMSCARLNELHATIGGPVGQDRLPPPQELAALLTGCGARILRAEESDESYLVLAERN